MGENETGLVIARLLAGAWRSLPPALGVETASVAAVTPALRQSGAAALVWRRYARRPEGQDPTLAPLRDAALRQVALNLRRLASLRAIVARLNEAGVVPLLFKGAALASAYPAEHVRPFGDFDLVLRPAERSAALAVLARVGGGGDPTSGAFRIVNDGACAVIDLHDDLPASYDLTPDRLFMRAVPLPLGEQGRLLMPRPEDHLRLVAMHMLRHGGWRPVWLADVAALVEAAGPEFDWQDALGRTPIARAWTATAIGLARRLLGCQPPPGAPIEEPPDWVVRTVLGEWVDPRASRFLSPPAEWSIDFLSRRLKSYWVNPIAAAIARGAPPSTRTPLLHQASYFRWAVTQAGIKAALGRHRPVEAGRP